MRHLIVCGIGVFVVLLGRCIANEAKDNEIKEKEQVCKEKDKCLALIDIAEELVSKRKVTCSESDGAPDCSEIEKSSTYLELTKKLSDIKENFPSCKTYDCSNRPRDCSEVLANGDRKSGVYNIFPSSRFAQAEVVRVFCDMETDGGGWTVIQRRGNFSPQQDFYLRWKDYKKGFGDVTRDFWLGNDNIYALSNQGPVEIRIELGDVRGDRRYAVYDSFRLEDEANEYRLHVSNYSGDANDGMTQHSGKNFSTKDRGNEPAVTAIKGAWWIAPTAYSHLNGLYEPGEDNYKSVHWYEWLQNEGLAFAEMKVRLR